MKTLYVCVVALVVMFVSTCRGGGYDKFRDVENDFQDRFTKERREQIKSLFDPGCLIWTRTNPECFRGKRSFGARQVSIFSFPLLFLLKCYQSSERDLYAFFNP